MFCTIITYLYFFNCKQTLDFLIPHLRQEHRPLQLFGLMSLVQHEGDGWGRGVRNLTGGNM
uniref:Uncharacterized protein n=1 Tax=Maylandia zebra TaxID=106582 RepID=A0A3P9DT02_9CICH